MMMRKRKSSPWVNNPTNELNDTGLTANMEDYMENIALLLNENDVVRVKDIAQKLNITMPSVTAALQKLKEKGLVDYEKYGHVQLPSCRRCADRSWLAPPRVPPLAIKNQHDLNHVKPRHAEIRRNRRQVAAAAVEGTPRVSLMF